MNKVSGIGLLQNIKNGRLKDNSKIKVVFDDGTNQRDVAIMIYKNDELIWQPGKFKVSMLYDDYYEFEIIENNKIEKMQDFDLTLKETKITKNLELTYEGVSKTFNYAWHKIDEIINHINKIEEKLDER